MSRNPCEVQSDNVSLASKNVRGSTSVVTLERSDGLVQRLAVREKDDGEQPVPFDIPVLADSLPLGELWNTKRPNLRADLIGTFVQFAGGLLKRILDRFHALPPHEI